MRKKVEKKEKITWDKILADFKLKYPRLGKSIFHWAPEDYATIKVVLKDGMQLSYNYDEGRAKIVYDGWDDERRKR